MQESPPIRVTSSVPSAKLAVKKLYSSQFVRDAAVLLLLNTTARAVGFIGIAYAARCLGPVKLGTSALVQTTAQQVALVYNGGFDIAAVRKIARERDNPHLITGMVTAFRLSIAFFVALIWLASCFIFVSPAHLGVWLLGVPFILVTASSITFAFQGLEKLPVQNAITAGLALLTAAAYFLFFSPGIFLGADLVVVCVGGALAWTVSWYAYYRMFGRWPIVRARLRDILNLLQESRHYWVLAVVVYFYSVFQLPLIARLVGSHEAGIFRAAFLMASGLELLFSSVNSLLLPRLVVWSKLGYRTMWRQQIRLVIIYLAIGLPLVAVLFFSAPIVYRLILGQQFVEGIHVFQILLFGRLAVFLGQIYAWGLAAIGKDKQFLAAITVGALFSVTLNLILIPRYGSLGAACVSVMCELLIHSYCFLSFRAAIFAKG